MKILQILHSFPPHNFAGTEIYTYTLAKELAERHSVSIFHRICGLKKEEYEVDYVKSNGFDIWTINNTFRDCDSFEKLYRNDDITERFIEILDKVKPDIVHIQHLLFLSTTIIPEIKKRNIPIVFTLHDYWLICPQWHFLKKDLSICNNNDISECLNCLDYQLSIKKLPKKIYLKIRNIIPEPIMRFLKKAYLYCTKNTLDAEEIKKRKNHIKEICQMIDIFIAPSQFIKKKYIEFRIPEEKIKFIPHGIKIEHFKKKGSDKILFGFIGTILPAKGVDVLIKAFNMIDDSSAELKIYGRLFPYNGFEYYPEYIQRLPKNGNVRFLGEFEHKDVPHIFSELDVLVSPSIWNENCPLAILEAFSTKTPVIASRIGGVPELVKDGENGLLFEPGNVNELYDKMKTFISNSHSIGKINQPKTIEENTQEIEELYRLCKS